MNKQYDNWRDAVSNLTTDKYDNDFDNIEGLKWLPWVGKNYDSTRIFILGASHYEWKDSDKGESSKSKKFTRKVVAEHGIDSKNERHKKYAFAGFNKCLLNEEALHPNARGELWSSLLFYNLLQTPMKTGTDTIVKDEDALEAWEAFKKLVSILKPKICIAWGAKIIDHWVWKNKCVEFSNTYEYKNQISRCSPRESVITIGGHKLSICAIKHPSMGFSPPKWREYLLSQHKDKLQKIITG